MELNTGIKGYKELTVTPELTAAALGSGLLPVYATPAMVALMEETAATSVQPCLPEGQGTVGTLLELKHLSATPVGLKVFCDTELVEIDRRRLVFEFKCRDEAGLIGEGRHERFVIKNESFMAKANAKACI